MLLLADVLFKISHSLFTLLNCRSCFYLLLLLESFLWWLICLKLLAWDNEFLFYFLPDVWFFVLLPWVREIICFKMFCSNFFMLNFVCELLKMDFIPWTRFAYDEIDSVFYFFWGKIFYFILTFSNSAKF